MQTPPPPGSPEQIVPPDQDSPAGRNKMGPVQEAKSGTNWLPFVLAGGIGAVFLCAAGLLIFALFFFEPNVPEIAAPTQALDAIAFSTADAADATDNSQPATNTPVPAAAATDTPLPPPEAAATPATDGGTTPEAPLTENPPPPTPEPAPVSPDNLSVSLEQMPSPDYGIQAFLYWRSENADRDLKLVEDIAFNWVKQEFPWREIERLGKGQYDWANTDRMMDQIDSHGLKVIARISTQPPWAGGAYPEIGPPDNYQDYVDFLTVLATRYQGRIDAYQIWNEPNLSREWGERPPNPAEYTELLRLSYETIKAIDPEAIVITAGLAPTTRSDDVAMPDVNFIQGMYDAGAAPYFDALGVHGPGFKMPPQTDPAVVAQDPALNNNDPSPPELRRVYSFRRVEDLRAIMVANGDADKRVVVLEFGWTVDDRPDSPYYWHAVSELEQAQYIVDAYIYARNNWQPWIGIMSLIFLPDPAWTEDDEQYYWSITYPDYPDFRARAAYWGLLEYSRQRGAQ